MIEKDKNICNDLKKVFEMFDNENGVDIDGIIDNEMKNLLKTLFNSLHIDHYYSLYQWNNKNKLVEIFNNKILPYSNNKNIDSSLPIDNNNAVIGPTIPIDNKPITIGPTIPVDINNKTISPTIPIENKSVTIGPTLPPSI